MYIYMLNAFVVFIPVRYEKFSAKHYILHMYSCALYMKPLQKT